MQLYQFTPGLGLCAGIATSIILLINIDNATALSFHSTQRQPITAATTPSSRRQLIQQTATAFLGSASIILANPSPSLAAAPPSPKELQRLQIGQARVQYLLDNWDSITSTCGTRIMTDNERKQVIRTEGGGGGSDCERTPLRVQEFLGYKSTEDPLYRADKLLVRAASLVDPDDIEEYLDVIERYRDKADNVAMMAYTSSWGEANPNGGREVIDDYLDKTRDDVVSSEKLLRKVLGYLNLEVLPPRAKA